MKRITAFLLAAATLLAFSACGTPQKETSEPASPVSKAEVTLSAAEIAERLFREISYEDDLEGIEETPIEFVAAIYGIDEALLADAAVYMGSNATPEEICVMKSASDDTSALKTAAESRLATRIEDFTDYNPEQMPKLDSAVVYVSGRYVIFSVSGSADKAKAILNELFA